VDAVTAFVFVLALLALGKLIAHLRLLPESTPEALNQFVILICLPATVLLHASRLTFTPALALTALLPWLLLVLSTVLVWSVARVARFSVGSTAVLLLAVPLGNTAFLGYPLLTALLGESALPQAVIYDQLGTFLILSTFGLWVVARYGHGSAPGARAMLARILRFPPFLALIVALTIMPAELPAWLSAILARLADALLPLVAIAIGMQLKLRLPRNLLAPFAFGLGAKLLLAPLIVLALAQTLGAAESARTVATLQAAMPVMITAMALAGAAKLEPELGAALVGYSTVIAAATLPLWRWLL
jgi:predicted permease